MTKEDVIEMARECGFVQAGYPSYVVFTNEMLRFADLVAAAERERMLQNGWRRCADGQRTTQFCGQLQQAVVAEREACAQVCEEHWEIDGTRTAKEFAAAIRARGQA